MIADYWYIRRTHIEVEALYQLERVYGYRKGWNPAALLALSSAVLLNVPDLLATEFPKLFGFVPSLFTTLYGYAWFVGVAVAVAIYCVDVPRRRRTFHL